MTTTTTDALTTLATTNGTDDANGPLGGGLGDLAGLGLEPLLDLGGDDAAIALVCASAAVARLREGSDRTGTSQLQHYPLLGEVVLAHHHRLLDAVGSSKSFQISFRIITASCGPLIMEQIRAQFR